jgi:nucleotidyltransferase substrate binding protein (TIGR01987 family)
MVKYDAERFELQREYFYKALDRLNEALAEDETPFVRDSVIQRFEMTFEMAWKCLYRFLRDKGEQVAAKAWDVLPEAFKASLIEDADVWELLRQYRNDTSHEYNEDKAIEIAAFVRKKGVPAFEALRAEMARRA